MTSRFNKLTKLGILAVTGRLNKRALLYHGAPVKLPNGLDVEKRYEILRKRHKTAMARAIKANIATGAAVIELGAGMGLLSALVRRQIGAESPLIVIEPNPVFYEICAANAGTDNLSTQLVRAALGYDRETVALSVGADPKVSNQVEVPATSLGQIALKLERKPFILVCNIGGAEAELVAQDTDALMQCQKVILELHPETLPAKGSSSEEVIARLEFQGLMLKSRDDNVVVMAR